MENIEQSKTYELAYHIVPTLEEAEVTQEVQQLENLISQYGGYIVASQQPKKIHLSYPIRHQRFAYFGYFDFSAKPETIKQLNAQMKLQNHILRYLVLTKEPLPTVSQSAIDTNAQARARKGAERKTEAEIDPTQMDQEIADVLEKIS